jgi:hypothetical protein
MLNFKYDREKYKYNSVYNINGENKMNMTKKTLSIVISLLIVASSGAVIIYGALNHKENNEITMDNVFFVIFILFSPLIL